MASPLGNADQWQFRNWLAPVINITNSVGPERQVGIAGAGALRLVVPTTEYELYDLLYLNYAGDGAGGTFAYMPNDSNADDGIDYIIPASITRPTTGTFVRTQ